MMIAFVLITSSLTIHDYLDQWSWKSFGLGLGCGLPILTAWWNNKHIATLLSIIGFIMLGAAAFGLVDDLERDRLFFSGMTLGMVVGIYPAVLFTGYKSYKQLALYLHMDGYHKAADRMMERYEEAKNRNS